MKPEVKRALAKTEYDPLKHSHYLIEVGNEAHGGWKLTVEERDLRWVLVAYGRYVRTHLAGDHVSIWSVDSDGNKVMMYTVTYKEESHGNTEA